MYVVDQKVLYLDGVMAPQEVYITKVHEEGTYDVEFEYGEHTIKGLRIQEEELQEIEEIL